MRVGGDVSGSGKRALGSTHRETDSLECSVETGNAWCGVSEVSYCLESAGDFGVEAVHRRESAHGVGVEATMRAIDGGREVLGVRLLCVQARRARVVLFRVEYPDFTSSPQVLSRSVLLIPM